MKHKDTKWKLFFVAALVSLCSTGSYIRKSIAINTSEMSQLEENELSEIIEKVSYEKDNNRLTQAELNKLKITHTIATDLYSST